MCKRHKFEFPRFEQEKLICTNNVIGFGGRHVLMMKMGMSLRMYVLFQQMCLQAKIIYLKICLVAVSKKKCSYHFPPPNFSFEFGI